MKFKESCIKIRSIKFIKIKEKVMKKKVLLLVLGILGAYQLGYSENLDTKAEEASKVEMKQNQTESEETESDQTAKNEEEPQTAVAPIQKETPKAKKLTPAQEKRLEAKAKKNKEKNMSLDEKLDLQILKMERLLKSLEGR